VNNKQVLLLVIGIILIAAIVSIFTIYYQPQTITQNQPSCKGSAACYYGTVTEVYDGDTVYVDGEPIRLALTSTPELDQPGGIEARQLSLSICPIGSTALVDEDDGQLEGSFARLIGVVYCNGKNLNAALPEANMGKIDERFCDESEFSNEEWVRKFGCN
jgi:micrococcal nuclease